ncbi:MAG: hypothetical protein LC099_10170 [Anaerolineales bacterium]|nr:hypothetical protein [Anaerolineales bacterium]
MRILAAIVAIAVGLLVLLGYFVPQAAVFQTLLLNWAIIFAAAAALVGMFNLINVHAEKIRKGDKNKLYSAVLIVGLIAAFLAALILKPQNAIVQTFLVNGIIVPVEASLMALLAISLLYAAARLLRRRADLMSAVFVAVAALLFLGSATLPFGDMPLFGSLLRPYISQVWALGGARGILIGVGLGALTAGLRVLLGVDRPYGGA